MSNQPHLMSDRALEMVAQRFKLLGEPMRLRLLQLLMAGEKRVTDLVQATGTTQANVSRHLAILADGGLVARRKAGVTTFYRIADPSLFTLCDLVCRSLQERGVEMMQSLHSSEEE